MKSLIHYCLLLIVLLSLQHCASYNKESCGTKNWSNDAYSQVLSETNISQSTVAKINEFNKYCQKHGQTMSIDRFKVSFNDHKNKYCSSLADGRSDKQYARCMPFPHYKSGYDQGILSYCSDSQGRTDARKNGLKNTKCTVSFDYRKGFEEGIIDYCTYKKAKKLSLKGYIFNKRNCPSSRMRKVNKGARVGKKIYELRAELASITEKINNQHSKIQSLTSSISSEQSVISRNKSRLKSAKKSKLSYTSYVSKINRAKKTINSDQSDLDSSRNKLTRLEKRKNRTQTELMMFISEN